MLQFGYKKKNKENKGKTMNTTIQTLNTKLTEVKAEIKSLTITKATILKDVFNVVRSDVKNLKETNSSLSNKQILELISETETISYKTLDKDIKELYRLFIIYFTSKSNLDFSNLSITRFKNGMKLINQDKATRFKNNDELIEAIKEDTKNKEIARFKKLYS